MLPENGYIETQAPSNIAFVKYWGKRARQYPINPSVSMTLKNCVTNCRLHYKKSDAFCLESYHFQDRENQQFKQRIEKYLSNILDICPILNGLSLSIETTNSFPHSAGIASSASAFASIAHAIASLEEPENIKSRASELARLGSGSAARSISGPFMIWGECSTEKSSNDYAVEMNDIHPDFLAVNDTVLLIDSSEKQVSSSMGHSLIDDHPYREARIKQAHQNTETILKAMRSGDWQELGNIIENEALSLHAMMMASNPSVLLLSPNTLKVIDKVKDFRKETHEPLYFTIDAGPNVHLIYPKKNESKIQSFIQSELSLLCENGEMIMDENGNGAEIINAQ